MKKKNLLEINHKTFLYFNNTQPSFFTNFNYSCYILSCLLCQPVEIAVIVYECYTMIEGLCIYKNIQHTLPISFCNCLSDREKMLILVSPSLSLGLGEDSLRNERKFNNPRSVFVVVVDCQKTSSM